MTGDDNDDDLVEELFVSFAEGESGPWLGDFTHASFGVRFAIVYVRSIHRRAHLYVNYGTKGESAKRVVRLATVASNLLRKHGPLL